MSLESVSKISELTGADRRTLKKLFEHLSPIIEGTSHLYETKEALPLVYRKPQSNESDTGNLDIVQERARLTYHQANIAELDEDVRRGELIPADVVERVWSDMAASFRAKILSIPTKAAHQFVNLTNISEIQDALKEHHCEALLELSDYEPKDYGINTRKNNSE